MRQRYFAGKIDTNEPRNSVFPITRTQDNATIGTGFIIHRESGATFFLTCAHVVADAEGPENVRIHGEPAAVVSRWPVRDCNPDMAVLKVQKDFGQAPLDMEHGGRAGAAITILGFYRTKKNIYVLRPLNGTLGEILDVTDGTTTSRGGARDLLIEGDFTLKGGYSGSPVIDTQSRTAIGMASDLLGKGDKGIAVSMAALELVWPDMRKCIGENLPGFEKETPAGSHYDDSDRDWDCEPDHDRELDFARTFARFLCDRKNQVRQFVGFFKKCMEGECAGGPQFYIIHGNDNEGHYKLLERLRLHELRPYTEEKFRRKAPRPKEPLEAPLENLRSLEDHMDDLIESLFRAVNPKYHGPITLSHLCDHPDIRNEPVVIIKHDIYSVSWRNHYAQLLYDYMTDFWAQLTDFTDRPLFLIFFNVIYPVPKPGSMLKRWLDPAIRNKKWVQKELNLLAQRVSGKCRCLLMHEIEPIEISDLNAWCTKWIHPNPDMWSEQVQDCFKDEACKCMKDIDKFIQELLKPINEKAFREHVK